jgi:hypothetical protein
MEEVIYKIKDLKVINTIKYLIIEEREKSIGIHYSNRKAS